MTYRTYEELTALRDKDAELILHPSSSIVSLLEQGPRIMLSAQGVRVTDIDGKEYIDGAGGLWCVNVGYGREEIACAMSESSRELSYFHTFNGASNADQIELAEQLLAMTPEKLGKVFYGCSGSDANDTLIKIVWNYNYLRGKPKKRKIIAREQAYHGTSLTTASLTGLKSFHRGFNLPFEFALHTDTPFYYRDALPGETEHEYSRRLADKLEALILEEGSDTIGAFIAEPVMGAGGVITPPEGYFEAIQAVLRNYDILMIADEVVCGFGRLGSWFGSDIYGIEPDMMATAKGLTSGYFPMSAAFISDAIWEVLRDGGQKLGSFAHGYTYSGHPAGAAVALANLRIYREENLVQNAAEVGAYFQRRLHDLFADHTHVGEIRGRGLLAGIQLVENKAEKRFFDPAKLVAAAIAKKAYEQGVIVRPLPSVSVLALSPPLCMTYETVDELLNRLSVALESVLD